MNTDRMSEVGMLRLYGLRAMYLLIAIGLGMTVWPLIISPPDTAANAKSVIRALLGALAILAAVGVRYPLRMLPLLLFELLWKVIWVVAFALRMWLDTGLDAYASETLFACLMGVVLVPIAIPWRYAWAHYARAAGDPWLKQAQALAARQGAP
jgi:formate hydrogenlyase subunit 3/multisubunit Na+/H+ antiporter MnhD subunit